MTLRESVKSPPALPQWPTPPPAPRRPQGWAWAKHLLAPLLGISVLGHGLLLLVPVPSGSVSEGASEIDETAAEEEFVDLLSISSLAAPEPEPELPAAAPPPSPAAATPSPSTAAAAAPTQPLRPGSYAETPAPPVTAPLGAPAAPEVGFEAAPEPPAVFVQEEEVTEIFSRLTRGAGDSDFDSTATSFPAIAYLTRGGIGGWSAAEQSCFFDQITADDYRLRPNAVSLRYLTRNEQFIRNEDVPNTFQPPEFQVSDLPGGFCNRTLFQVLRGGQPYLYVSIVGIGVGNAGQQGSGLVIIWTSDPRGG